MAQTVVPEGSASLTFSPVSVVPLAPVPSIGIIIVLEEGVKSKQTSQVG